MGRWGLGVSGEGFTWAGPQEDALRGTLLGRWQHHTQTPTLRRKTVVRLCISSVHIDVNQR